MMLRHGRTPKQQRSIERVERVLTAAGRVFAERGYAGATTNHIAEAAGVHVPSVYQYFDNKDALLAELWDRHVGELMTMLTAMLEANLDAAIETVAQAYVGAVLELHYARPRYLAVLYQEAPRLTAVRDLRTEAVERLVPYLERRSDELEVTDLHGAAFVLAAAVEGVARQAVVEPAPKREVLATELTRLVTRYLGAS